MPQEFWNFDLQRLVQFYIVDPVVVQVKQLGERSRHRFLGKSSDLIEVLPDERLD